MACSRMPKWRFLPPGLSAWKSPAPSNFRVVLFDGPRSAEPPRNQGMFCASTFSTLPEASRPAMPFGIGREDGQVAVPAGRQLAPLHLVDLGGEFGVLGPVGGEEFRPLPPGLRAALADAGGEVLADAVGDEELRVLGPAVEALAQADFLLAERLAVRLGGVLLVRGTVADVAVQDDEGGAALRLPEDLPARARCGRCRWRRPRAGRSSRSPGTGPRRPP